MTTIQIMNLSSGAFISLKQVNIANLNLIQDLNWDSVDVIGRMNGIKNYKNTTRKKSFDIKTDEKSVVSIHTPRSEVSSNTILIKFKARTDRIKMLDNPVYFQTESLNNFLNNGQYLQRFFYPSYLEETNNYFMQSAPMFYFRMINGNLESTAYCIIRSFNFEVNDFGPNKVINTFNLKFEIEEIASNIDQVSSIVRTKTTGA